MTVEMNARALVPRIITLVAVLMFGAHGADAQLDSDDAERLPAAGQEEQEPGVRGSERHSRRR